MRFNQCLRSSIVFLMLVVVLAAYVADAAVPLFSEAPLFNSLILAVMALGVVGHLWQILRLRPEDVILTNLIGGVLRPPRGYRRGHQVFLLSPLLDRLTASSTPPTQKFIQGLTDSIHFRLAARQQSAVYLTRLALFLGLIGTAVAVTQDMSQQDMSRDSLNFAQILSPTIFGFAGYLVLAFLNLKLSEFYSRFLAALSVWLAEPQKLEKDLTTETFAPPPPPRPLEREEDTPPPEKREPTLD